MKREYRNYAQPEALMKRTGHVHDSALQILSGDSEVVMAAWAIVAPPYCVSRRGPFALVEGVP